MKIPTKRTTNTKQTVLAVTAFATVVGLAPAATTLAHGGFGGYDNDRQASTEDRSGDRWKNNSHHGWYGQSWWHIPSQESFESRHEAKLALYDKVIAKYDLTVENGEELRAAVETDATEVSAALTAYEQLKAELDDSDTAPTDEQKAALKDATLAALGALYDYRESTKEYVGAIKDAFMAKWQDETKLNKLEKEL